MSNKLIVIVTVTEKYKNY